ncbi:MAG: hypothetical protein JST08_19780 [Actinobacteria bacterium]|nr:hypothetical protein [Actinomycetota bacterium]
MSARLARLALALYPLAYRRRYGAEMAALLEDQGASPRAVADLVRGALRAHLRPTPAVAGELRREDRARLGISAVLLCWVLFALAGLALAKTSEGPLLEGRSGAPEVLGLARIGIELLAVVGSLAVAIGAAPLVLAALRQARTRPEVRRATLLVCGSVVAFVGATAALALIAGVAPNRSGPVDALILTAWTLVALACGVGCARAARRGLFAITVPPGALRLAAACASIVVAAMAGIALLTLAYLVALVVAATNLAAAPNGPLGNPDVRASLVIQLLAMAALVVPATIAATRTHRATRC